MTANTHFKQLVRRRMATHGEPYSTARAHVAARSADVSFNAPTVVAVHGRHGQSVAFTPDGTHVLSAGQDARIAILDARSGQEEKDLVGHDKVVNAVAVTPDGTTVVSVSSDRTVRTWDLSTAAPLATMRGHRDAVVALDVSPDGQHALTGGYDGRLRRWDLPTADCVEEHQTDLKRVAAVAFTPDGQQTVESGLGALVTVRDGASGDVVTVLDAAAPAVTGLAVSPDGAMLATGGYDGTITLWDCETWTAVRQLAAGDRVAAVSFSHDGQLLAAAATGRVALWSVAGDTPVASTDLPISGIYAVALSRDGRRLAQTGADGKVRIWTLR